MTAARGTPLIVATGSTGLVGRVLLARAPDLAPLGAPAPLDVTDAVRVSSALEAAAAAAAGRPLVVIHLAALTGTKGGDGARFEEVNVRGTGNVLKAARGAGASLIHVSTDYVFAGESRKGLAYREDERPKAVPPGVYAASKFRAENLVLDAGFSGAAVVRIAFPYGGLGNRPGLAEKMVLRFEEARRKKEPVKLFRDQIICPSYIPDIVRGLLSLARLLPGGGAGGRVFHLVGEPTTPLDFGGLVRRAFGFEDVAVEASSVQGTPYAANLHLSTEATRKALSWRPTPHGESLAKLHREGGPRSL